MSNFQPLEEVWIAVARHKLKWLKLLTSKISNGAKSASREGAWRIGRAPDCLVSHVCVPGSNPPDPTWVFQMNIIVSPFSV